MTIPKEIIDNSEGNKLVTFLNNMLGEYPQTNLDIATAFFNVQAYAMVKDNLNGVKRFRLLLGKAPEIKSQRTLGDELLSRLKEEVEGFELSKEKESTVKDLIDFLKQDNVEIKLYDKEFLHGKAYIFDNLVVIGSSNFTASGLTHNTELNAVSLEESKAIYTREKWFEKFWAESNDFKRELIQLLEDSRFGSTEYQPYQIYMKALYELQKEELKAEEKKDEKTGRPPTKVNLAEFQDDAVERIMSRLEKYGAILVADSVGLGKTWIAKKILEEIGYYERRCILVICPAQLRSMWKTEMKKINISENVMSQEELASEDFLQKAKRAVGGKLSDVDLIVVDESHNFRNPMSNRWENLFTLVHDNIAQKGNTPYMMFLTATPINNTIWDLYWQIMLLVSTDRRAFMKENIPDLFQFFKDVDKRGDPSLLNDLLNEISIRRTRDYIKANYPDAYILKEYPNGEKKEEKIIFPERELENISYELDKTYKGMYEWISDIITEKLTMAYYRLLKYKKEEKRTPNHLSKFLDSC
ncbi:MAG: phospholipase D-like domain-containing protein, partial [Candidatus Zixiibacteriota bacterium]